MPPILTDDEQVTLRRVAYGQSEVRAMRKEDLGRLRRLRLIEESKDGPRLTPEGKECFDLLPKAASLGSSGHYDELLEKLDSQSLPRRR
ncbi:MAG: hypothetical protein KIT25_08010 [Enhydrobacter sp.]|nr:MAG: hypothetical protein KIT25_08010 [Enhydrobacter sp.]